MSLKFVILTPQFNYFPTRNFLDSFLQSQRRCLKQQQKKKKKKQKKSRKTDYLPNDDNEATKLKIIKNNRKLHTPELGTSSCI